jgi:hypothetical protein
MLHAEMIMDNLGRARYAYELRARSKANEYKPALKSESGRMLSRRELERIKELK